VNAAKMGIFSAGQQQADRSTAALQVLMLTWAVSRIPPRPHVPSTIIASLRCPANGSSRRLPSQARTARLVRAVGTQRLAGCTVAQQLCTDQQSAPSLIGYRRHWGSRATHNSRKQARPCPALRFT
jgi:hypothetical protein